MTTPATRPMRERSLAARAILPILLLIATVGLAAGVPSYASKANATPIPLRGAAYPLRSDPFVQQGELSDDPGASGEDFGEAIAVSGRTLVAGTPNHKAASTDLEQGAAYVFTAPASGWTHARQIAILKAPRDQSEELFGRSVAISASTIVVGAPFREVDGHAGQGAVYVFVKPASGWSHASPPLKLTATRGQTHEFFGESVAISGHTVTIGAPGRQVAGHAGQGAVDVFAIPAARTASPTQLAQLTAPDGLAHDALGISVAVSGEAVIAGADLHRVGTVEQGAAYVFVRPASGWRHARAAAQLMAKQGQARELFGRSVAFSHDTVVVGAPDHDSIAPVPDGIAAEEGAAYVFVKPPSGWAGSLTQTAQLAASDPGKGDQFGGALAISGARIAVGAPGHATGKSTEQGAGYVFEEPPTGWENATETDQLIAKDGAEGDKLGLSVALSGATILLSAPNHEVNGTRAQGAVYSFRR
jgi:FG-GAP repeat protein